LTPRETAYQRLKRIYADKAFSNLALDGDGAFVRALVLGCIERRYTLEYVISRYAKSKPDTELLLLLQTGVYQIMYMDVPDSAACDETVEIAKKYFDSHRTGFVNAILRSVCRSKDELIKAIDSECDEVKYSIDGGICRMIRDNYDDADAIMQSFFGRKKTYVRVNNIKTTSKAVADRLQGVALDGKTVSTDNTALAVSGIDLGDYYIQGIGSQTAVKLLDAQPQMTVADVCACPGGKTFGAAIDMGGTGTVYSSDIRKSKLSLVESGAKRLGLSNISVSLRDARQADESLVGKCDRVICDVPCSALGEMASKPEIRYKSTDDFDALYATQRAILESAATLLKSGGKLVYSTCTINPIENSFARQFVSANDGYSLEYEHTFLPHTDGEGEGFYVALILRQ